MASKMQLQPKIRTSNTKIISNGNHFGACPLPGNRRSLSRAGTRRRAVIMSYDLGQDDVPITAPKLQEEVKPFVMVSEPSAVASFLKGVPSVGRMAGGLVLVAGAAAAGFTAGSKLPAGTPATAGKVVGTVALGAAAGAGAMAMDKQRKDHAPKELSNSLVGREPCSLQSSEVAAINEEYGVDMSRENVEQLQGMYHHYFDSLFPPGDVPLGGWEADALIKFKAALGLEDADAAKVHQEMGNRIFRMRAEMGKRSEEALQKQAFQKLVFLSNLVFGEAKARFLLPWKRWFKVSDAQVALAVKQNGSVMYKKFLLSFQDPVAPDEAMLKEARDYQLRINLEDEPAAEILKVMCRERVEKVAERASEVLKSSGRTRARDVAGAVAAVDEILAYNKQMESFAGRSEVAVGVGSVNMWGGIFHEENKTSELRDLYRMYLAENIKDGLFTEEAEAKLSTLQKVFGLGTKEAEDVTITVQTKAYRNHLRRAVQDGTLDAAESKAAFLTELCERLRFPGETAASVHSEIYKQKLESFLEKKSLTDKDEEELLRLRVLLCIPEATVTAAHRERCGAIFRETLELALSSGIDGFSSVLCDKVVKAAQDLRLDQDLALELLAANCKKVFMSYIKLAKGKSTRLDQAKELKKMVYFSNLVVSPLLDGIKPPTKEEIEAEKAQAEIAKIMEEAKAMAAKEEAEEAKAAEGDAKVEGDKKAEDEEGDKKDSLTKTTEAADAMASGETMTIDGKTVKVKSQKKITLADQMEMRDRQDLYRNYLLYCMSGDSVDLPMGASVVIERDQTEFLRLSQLGDVLGLTQMDVADVHKGLAEQAFRNNVQQVLADGNMTKEKSEYLKDAQKQLGLPDDAAKVIIRGIMNSKLMGNVQAQVSQGKMTMAEVRNLASQDVDMESMLSLDMRNTLYRKEVERMLTQGTGEFDREEMTETVPQLLKLDAKKAEAVVKEISKERKKDSLVSAVAQVRMKDADAALKSMNNLLACHLADPNTPVSWPVPEELQDLYSLYVLKKGSKTDVLQGLLMISDETRNDLESIVAAGNFSVDQEAGIEDEALF